jgi:tRNA dimethylallyltransferase
MSAAPVGEPLFWNFQRLQAENVTKETLRSRLAAWDRLSSRSFLVVQPGVFRPLSTITLMPCSSGMRSTLSPTPAAHCIQEPVRDGEEMTGWKAGPTQPTEPAFRQAATCNNSNPPATFSCVRVSLSRSPTFSCGRGQGEGSDAPPEPPPSAARDSAAPIKVGFIVGPTGIGKTAVALAVAERLGAEIVNADSRQVYRGMDIGTAKPGPAELARVRHHLVDVRSPGQPLDVAQFRNLARAAIAEVAARGRPVLVTGGSGLYLRVLRFGIFDGPGAAPEVRRALLQTAAEHGVEYLYDELRGIDPPAAARLEPRDLYRIVRALEVFRVTGLAMSRHQAAHGFNRPEYDTLTIGLRMDRERLYRTIGERFDAMLTAGLVGEVRALLEAGYTPHIPPLSTIGYKHIAAFLQGGTTLEAAIELAKRDTRRLAKRQLTWFRREPDVVWIDVDGGAEQAYTRFAEFFAAPAEP